MNIGAILAGAAFGGAKGMADANFDTILKEEEMAREEGLLRLKQYYSQQDDMFKQGLSDESDQKRFKRDMEYDEVTYQRQKGESDEDYRRRLAEDETSYQRRRGEDETDYQRRRGESLDDRRSMMRQGAQEELMAAEALGVPVQEYRKLNEQKKLGLLERESGMKGKDKLEAIASLREAYEMETSDFDDGSSGGFMGIGSKPASKEKPDFKTWAKENRPDEAALIWGGGQSEASPEQPAKKTMTADDIIQDLLQSKPAESIDKPVEEPTKKEPDFEGGRERASAASKEYAEQKNIDKEKKILAELVKKRKKEGLTPEEELQYKELKYKLTK